MRFMYHLTWLKINKFILTIFENIITTVKYLKKFKRSLSCCNKQNNETPPSDLMFTSMYGICYVQFFQSVAYCQYFALGTVGTLSGFKLNSFKAYFLLF